ncbi:uncharacterized protein LOC121367556 isoform X2 [Gigantopelta aegis]|nr:uncharacterized protein LOC121367556 isoform X2 [Gigantopelta aegis]
MKRHKSHKEKEHLSHKSAQLGNKHCVNTRHSVPWVGEVSVTKVCIVTFLALSGAAIVLHDMGYLSRSPEPDHRTTFHHSELSQPRPAPLKGGWRTAEEDILHKYDSSLCLVDRVFADRITVDQFEREYQNKKPVIIKFRNGARGWTQPELWSVDGLRHSHGPQGLMVGVSREIVQNGGNGYVETTVTDFIDSIQAAKSDKQNEPFYVFDRAFIQDSHLLNTLNPPEYLSIRPQRDDSFFFLGSSGSGVSFHNHAEAWNGVVYGSKRWFLYSKETAPPGGVYPGYSQLDWFSKVYPVLSETQKPVECVQQAGEIIYLPEGMYHGTINIGDTVAVGIQKKEATLPEMKLQYEETQLSKEESSEVPSRTSRRFECIKTLHSLLPDNTEWEMRLGEILFTEMNQPGEGIHHTEQVLQKDPFFLLALINLANFQAEIGQYEEAEILFVRALEQNPTAWDVYAQYGTFLFKQRRFSEAVSLFEKGFELKPNEKAFLIYLRNCQIQMGDHSAVQITQRKLDEFHQL